MNRAVITGLGFITSIGNSRSEVLSSLRETRSGIELFADYVSAQIPVKLAGTVKGFSFPSPDFEDWTYPTGYSIRREDLRPMPPHAVYGFCAMQQAIQDAGLNPDEVSHERVGILGASGGSMWLAHHNLNIMEQKGVYRFPPLGLVASIPGTLTINLAATFKIKGACLGFASACASSSHALGYACDAIRLGRLDRVFVVGAEDLNVHSTVPFAGVRALSLRTDPATTPCAFDVKRDGFLPTGGATVLVVESEAAAKARGAAIYSELLGWAETSDGYNVMAPEPTGAGLARSMALALKEAGLQPGQIDYLNAHATSTPPGDLAELRAIKTAFPEGQRPHVSSTKSLTGHGLCLAGAMEAGFCCLALKEGFMPVSANITELDPEAEGVPVLTSPVDKAPVVVMSNSSGFGGSNVSLILRRWS